MQFLGGNKERSRFLGKSGAKTFFDFRPEALKPHGPKLRPSLKAVTVTRPRPRQTKVFAPLFPKSGPFLLT
jgi:hypothetical protein